MEKIIKLVYISMIEYKINPVKLEWARKNTSDPADGNNLDVPTIMQMTAISFRTSIIGTPPQHYVCDDVFAFIINHRIR